MADDHGFEYDDEDSINKHLKCSLCHKPFVRPVIVRCKNKQLTFCRHCIEEWIDHNHSCPTCHQNLNIRQLAPVPNGIVTDMLDDLPIKCLSCEQTRLRRGNFLDHKDKMCPPVDMYESSSDIACVWTRARKQFDNDSDSENQKLRAQVNQQQSEIESLQDVNERLKIQLSQRQSEIGLIQNVNEQLIVDLREQKARLDTFEEKNQRLTARTNEQEIETATFRDENQQLKLQVDRQKSQIETLENKNQDLKAQIDRLKTDIETLQREVEQLKTKTDGIERLQVELAQLRDQVNQQQTQNGRSAMNIRQDSATTDSQGFFTNGYIDDGRQDNNDQHRPSPKFGQYMNAIIPAAQLLVRRIIEIKRSADDDKRLNDNQNLQPNIYERYLNAIKPATEMLVKNLFKTESPMSGNILSNNAESHYKIQYDRCMDAILPFAQLLAQTLTRIVRPENDDKESRDSQNLFESPLIADNFQRNDKKNMQTQTEGPMHNHKQLSNNQNQQQLTPEALLEEFQTLKWRMNDLKKNIKLITPGKSNNLPNERTQSNHRGCNCGACAQQPSSTESSDSPNENGNGRSKIHDRSGDRSTKHSTPAADDNHSDIGIDRRIGNTYN